MRYLVVQVDEQLLETVRFKDLESGDIEHSNKCARCSSAKRLVDPLDYRPKHLLVQSLAQGSELVDDLLRSSCLRYPFAPCLDLGSDKCIGELAIVDAE